MIVLLMGFVIDMLECAIICAPLDLGIRILGINWTFDINAQVRSFCFFDS